MPIEFIGEWCFDLQEDKTTQYRLPSWIGEFGHCTKIISIAQWGFEDATEYCEAMKVRLTHETAHTGTSYTAIVTARCNPNGSSMTTATTKTFQFDRYKGNLTVTTKGSTK